MPLPRSLVSHLRIGLTFGLICVGVTSSELTVIRPAEAAVFGDFIRKIWGLLPGTKPCPSNFAVLAAPPPRLEPAPELGPRTVLMNRSGRSYVKRNKLKLMEDLIEKIKNEVPEESILDVNLNFALENPYGKNSAGGPLESVKSFHIGVSGRKKAVLEEMESVKRSLIQRKKIPPPKGDLTVRTAQEVAEEDPESIRALFALAGRPYNPEVQVFQTKGLEGLIEKKEAGGGIKELVESKFVGLLSSEISFKSLKPIYTQAEINAQIEQANRAKKLAFEKAQAEYAARKKQADEALEDKIRTAARVRAEAAAEAEERRLADAEAEAEAEAEAAAQKSSPEPPGPNP